MPIAREVMQTNLVTIPVNSTVEDAVRVLMEHGISGAPVVDGQGELVGIVSELQFLEAVYTPEIMSHRLERFITRDVLTVTEETALAEVTNILVLQRIRRVPVTREGRLAGIITRRDLLRFAMETRQRNRDEVESLTSA